MDAYSRAYEIRWSDIDANGHVNYAAYIDAAGDLRYHFFAEHGYPPARFQQLGIGPVYMGIQARFFREVLLGETVTLTYSLTGLSPKGMHWTVHHDVLKANGKKAVSIDLEGTILDLAARRPVEPGPELMEVFARVPRAADFKPLPDTRWLV